MPRERPQPRTAAPQAPLLLSQAGTTLQKVGCFGLCSLCLLWAKLALEAGPALAPQWHQRGKEHSRLPALGLQEVRTQPFSKPGRSAGGCNLCLPSLDVWFQLCALGLPLSRRAGSRARVWELSLSKPRSCARCLVLHPACLASSPGGCT